MNTKPYFADEILISWEVYYERFVAPFLIKIHRSENQNVDLALCIGTCHAAYIDKTWDDLYHKKLVRFRYNIELLKANPEYYLSSQMKESISFYKHKTKYFIEVGHHRTVIGRYYLNSQRKEEVIKGVYVVEYVTDQE